VKTNFRIMALDVGKKRIGVALTDELRIFASPHSSIVLSSNRKPALNEIISLCKSSMVTTIVVGYPLNMQGEKTEQAVFTEKFTAALKKQIEEDNSLTHEIHVTFMDERLTSVEAERHLSHSGKKNLERRKAKDQISASIILDAYLLSLSKVR
jgi:putative Holliday junction resolvase